jgi:hypothetical protein
MLPIHKRRDKEAIDAGYKIMRANVPAEVPHVEVVALQKWVNLYLGVYSGRVEGKVWTPTTGMSA